MNKFIPLVLITTLGLSGVAMAKPHPEGGFNDGTQKTEHNMGGFKGGVASVATVEQIKNLADDAWVVLVGHITKQVGKNEYLFKDATGEIQVDIDHKKWKGLSITPEDLVEITGEVDKDWNKVEIDVKKIRLAPPAHPVK